MRKFKLFFTSMHFTAVIYITMMVLGALVKGLSFLTIPILFLCFFVYTSGIVRPQDGPFSRTQKVEIFLGGITGAAIFVALMMLIRHFF